jgi:hypothetical protein
MDHERKDYMFVATAKYRVLEYSGSTPGEHSKACSHYVTLAHGLQGSPIGVRPAFP